jgi:glycosyltransferase involved in cell wall biosynthesis
MKKVQFFTKINTRNGFRGAQVKTWDYYQFIHSHPHFECRIQFHPQSQWSKEVYWPQKDVLNEGECFDSPDILLLKGGNDWLLYEKLFGKTALPVVSPIVNYRVLNPSHPSHELLKRTAVRVCPNPDLAEKIRALPAVNGPVFCIPHGVDLTDIEPPLIQDRDVDLLIIAVKNKSMGEDVYNYYAGQNSLKVQLLDRFIPHNEFVKLMSQSKVCLHLPQIKESFYLPGLESLALGCLTVMPKCMGNEFYCKSIEGSFLCDYNKDDLIQTTSHVLQLSNKTKTELSEAMIPKASAHSLQKEKQQWHEVLNQLPQMI